MTGARDELCGRTLGEFVLRERIGEGAFGEVYRCEQLLLGREAVVKVLHGRHRASQVVIRRFLREARLASRLDHPYAAHIYAFGVEKDDGLLWIAMEMVHGTSFDRWLCDRGPLVLAEFVPFFERIAEVVHTAHEVGIVHRDLKPSNIMVIERAGRLLPKLLDFGIAKLFAEEATKTSPVRRSVRALDDEGPINRLSALDTLTASDAGLAGLLPDAELTAAGTVVGSPPYMAPEQWSGELIGPHSDLYSLSILAYEALAGRRPFVASSIAGLSALHLSAPVPSLGPGFPQLLECFFERALAKQPSDRPATALELAAELRVASGLDELPGKWIADEQQSLIEIASAETELPCPYPGMRAYSADTAAHFHGREVEVDDLFDRLCAGEREIYVIGPSGSGKSSLVAAGVLPRLALGVPELGMFLVRSLRPGEQPATRLAETLEGDIDVPVVAVESLLAREAPCASILLVIDQLEELFTLASDGERANFLAALRALRAEPRCVLLFTLRADFYGAFMESLLWSDLHGRISRIEVAPLRGPALRVAIERPARDLGVSFEPELVERLLADAASEPGILPLLQETLIQLWDRRRLRLLTLTDYQALGDGGRSGLAVAISRRADATLRGLTEAQEGVARRILLRLINFGEGRSDTRRQQPRSKLRAAGDDVADFEHVLRQMTADRLLTMDDDDNTGEPRVDLAHEVMITAWPTLAGWIQAHRADEQRRRQLEAVTAQWVERGRGARGLLDASELADAEAWQRTESAREIGQSADLAELVVASRAAHTKQRRQRRGLVWGAFATLTILAIVVSTLVVVARRQVQEEETSRKRAEQLVRSYVERGQQALFGGNVEEARSSLEAAYRMGARTPAVLFMLARARESIEAELATLDGHAGQVWHATFSPDGTRVLTDGHDTVVHIWDPATGRELHALRDHAPPVVAAWIPGGEVLTADAVGEIRIWTGDGRLRASIETTPSASSWIAFTDAGARFAVAKADGNVAIGDTRAGELRAMWKADPSSLDGVAFDPAGERVVTAGTAGTAIIWSLEGRELIRLEGHTDPIWKAMFDPTGERVITASLDATVRVWDARTGKTIHRLGHDARVTSFAIDEPARRIATTSADTTVRVWRLDTGEALVTLRGHTAQVNGAAFTADNQLVTTSSDGTARVWDLDHGVQTIAYHHGGFLLRPGLDPGARRLATASWSGTAKIWDLRRQSRLTTYASPVARTGNDNTRSLGAVVAAGRLARIGTRGIVAWELGSGRHWTWSGPNLVDAAVSRDGRIFVAADTGGFLYVLDANGTVLRRFRGSAQGVTCVAIFPDGERAATCAPGGTVAVWDLATGRMIANRRLGPVSAISVSGDGGAVAAFEIAQTLEGSTTGWLLAGDLSREIRLDHEGVWHGAMFSPDHLRLATLSYDHTVRIWNRDGVLEATLPHSASVLVAAWSPDGSWIVTGTGSGALTIWDRPTWRPRKVFEAHVSFVSAVAIDAHATSIASAGGDGIVKIWDVEQLLQIARIPTGKPVQHLAFERDRILISGPLATQSWRCDRYEPELHPLGLSGMIFEGP